MKLLLIGHSVEDHIHVKGEEKLSPGGLFYTSSALSAFTAENDNVYIATCRDTSSYPLFEEVYSKLIQDYVTDTEAIPKVHLDIYDEGERGERYENFTQHLNVRNIEDWDSFDGILINMITGQDILLEDLKYIRSKYKGIIFMDAHSLSRSLDENSRMKFRKLENAGEWIENVNLLQVNEYEIASLSSFNEEFQQARELLDFGLELLILTKGELGSRIYWMEKGELVFFSLPALKTNVVNKVGCGDTFGAVFFYSYIKDRNLYMSAKLANTAAGCLTEYGNVKEIQRLKDDTFSRLD